MFCLNFGQKWIDDFHKFCKIQRSLFDLERFEWSWRDSGRFICFNEFWKQHVVFSLDVQRFDWILVDFSRFALIWMRFERSDHILVAFNDLKRFYWTLQRFELISRLWVLVDFKRYEDICWPKDTFQPFCLIRWDWIFYGFLKGLSRC